MNVSCNLLHIAKDKKYLNGKWRLVEVGALNQENTFFAVDSSDYNFKKLLIDIGQCVTKTPLLFSVNSI